MFNILNKEDSYTVTKVLCMLLEWQSVLIIDASSKKLSLAIVSFFYAREHTRYCINHFALVFRYRCIARLDGHSSRNRLDKPLIIHRRRNKQVSCLCSSENVSLCVTVHRQPGQITKSIVQLYIFYTHSYWLVLRTRPLPSAALDVCANDASDGEGSGLVLD